MFELVLRIGFSLLIVLGLMWGLAKVARRPLTGSRGTGNLAVLTRQQLSRTSSVAVVQLVDKAYLLGVTDAQINMLAETDLAAFERHPHHHVVDHREPIMISPYAAQWETLDAGDPQPDEPQPDEPQPDEPDFDDPDFDEPQSRGPEPVPLEAFVPPTAAPPAHGPLAGSVLSPQTWNAALDFLRERTARH